MKFPKNRGGFDGPARAKAMLLEGNPVAYLKQRLPNGALAQKKGEYLYATPGPTEEVADPPLLGIYRTNPTRPVNARLKTRATQRTLENLAPIPELVTGEANPMPASQVYVGDGYVLRLMYADQHDDEPGSNAGSALMWPVLHKIGNSDPEVLSLSEENEEGANVSFADVALFQVQFRFTYGNGNVAQRASEPERWPSIYAMGHDPAAGTFKFGILMGAAQLDGEQLGNLAFVGTTRDRTLASAPLGVDFPGEAIQWWQVRAWAVGRGHVVALMPPAPHSDLTAPPNAPRMLRTRDFGATWQLEPLPELQPFGSYYVIDSPGSSDDGETRTLVDGTIGFRTFVASPIGGGRIAIVVRGGEQTIYPDQGSMGRIKWMLFLSDETGANFVRQAWPLDVIDADSNVGMFERHPFEDNTPFAYDPVPSFWQMERELSCQHISAGPGSLFFSMSTEIDGVEGTLQRTWIVSTRDYGATWTLSPDLPQEALSTFEPDVKPGKFAQVAPRVGQRYASAAVPGALFLSSVKVGGEVRIYRTSALFEAFALASQITIEGFAPTVPINREGFMSKPVYVGTARPARTFIHPGFPGMFDKDGP